MKKWLTIVTLCFCVSRIALAEGGVPIDYEDVLKIYGQPVSDEHMPGGGGIKKFSYDGMIVEVWAQGTGVKSIVFKRDTPFNSLEIDSILKPLSAEETWKQVDDKNWPLSDTPCTAHCDGAGKITVK